MLKCWYFCRVMIIMAFVFSINDIAVFVTPDNYFLKIVVYGMFN